MEVDPPAQPAAAPPAAGTDAEPSKAEAPAPAMDNPQVATQPMQAYAAHLCFICVLGTPRQDLSHLCLAHRKEVGLFHSAGPVLVWCTQSSAHRHSPFAAAYAPNVAGQRSSGSKTASH